MGGEDESCRDEDGTPGEHSSLGCSVEHSAGSAEDEDDARSEGSGFAMAYAGE